MLQKTVVLVLALLAVSSVAVGLRTGHGMLPLDKKDDEKKLLTLPLENGPVAMQRTVPSGKPVLSHHDRYDGHSVLRCTGTALKEFLTENPMSLWASTPDAVDIQVSQKQMALLAHAQATEEIQCEEMIKDLSKSLRDHDPKPMRFREVAHGTTLSFFDTFRSNDDIVTFLQNLSTNNPNHVNFIPSIGKSLEGRDIPAVRICGSNNCDKAPKVYVQGLLHAREWIGGAASLFIAHIFASATSKSSDEKDSGAMASGRVTKTLESVGEKASEAATAELDQPLVARAKELLKSLELVVVPVVNPDGYAFTWEGDRLWRKNRRAFDDGTFGVDLNRNFDVPHPWGPGVANSAPPGVGESDDISSEVYRGPASFSEPEAIAVRDFVTGLAPANLRLLGLDLHSYGQRVLRGYGYQTPEMGMPEDEDLQKSIGDAAAEAMGAMHGETYVSEHAGLGHFIGAGGCDDWMHDLGHMLAFTMELRDTGTNGFLLSDADILPASREALEGVLTMAEHASRTHMATHDQPAELHMVERPLVGSGASYTKPSAEQ